MRIVTPLRAQTLLPIVVNIHGAGWRFMFSDAHTTTMTAQSQAFSVNVTRSSRCATAELAGRPLPATTTKEVNRDADLHRPRSNGDPTRHSSHPERLQRVLELGTRWVHLRLCLTGAGKADPPRSTTYRATLRAVPPEEETATTKLRSPRVPSSDRD